MYGSESLTGAFAREKRTVLGVVESCWLGHGGGCRTLMRSWLREECLTACGRVLCLRCVRVVNTGEALLGACKCVPSIGLENEDLLDVKRIESDLL